MKSSQQNKAKNFEWKVNYGFNVCRFSCQLC